MVTLRVLLPDREIVLTVEHGANLRDVLLAHGISPYAALTRRVNCGGRGLCATCGVWVDANVPDPAHWHDKLANGFGYPRLSCQIHVEEDMTVRIVNGKWIWGRRDTKRAAWFRRS